MLGQHGRRCVVTGGGLDNLFGGCNIIGRLRPTETKSRPSPQFILVLSASKLVSDKVTRFKLTHCAQVLWVTVRRVLLPHTCSVERSVRGNRHPSFRHSTRSRQPSRVRHQSTTPTGTKQRHQNPVQEIEYPRRNIT